MAGVARNAVLPDKERPNGFGCTVWTAKRSLGNGPSAVLESLPPADKHPQWNEGPRKESPQWKRGLFTSGNAVDVFLLVEIKVEAGTWKKVNVN